VLHGKVILPVDAAVALHQRREEAQISVIDGLAIRAQAAQTHLEMDRIPAHAGGQQQIQGRGGIELILVGPITDFPLAAKEEVARQGVKRLAFIEPQQHTATQLFAAQILRQGGRFDQAAQLLQAQKSLLRWLAAAGFSTIKEARTSPLLIATTKRSISSQLSRMSWTLSLPARATSIER
jgi:hypothetical protein